MERCITGVTGWQKPLCMSMTMNAFAGAAPTARRVHGGALHVRKPEQTIAGTLLAKCGSGQKSRSSQRRSRSVNQATSASQTRLAPVQTGFELIHDFRDGQGISAVLLELQKQESRLQVLKVTTELCKEYTVVPKSVDESDLKFWDEEDERLEQ